MRGRNLGNAVEMVVMVVVVVVVAVVVSHAGAMTNVTISPSSYAVHSHAISYSYFQYFNSNFT